MNEGKLVFAQLMQHLPLSTFRRCVQLYDGEHKVIIPESEEEEGEELLSSPDADDPQARAAAREWMKLLHEGNAEKLTARSSLPFYSGETIVARTREELAGILGAMVEEANKGQ